MQKILLLYVSRSFSTLLMRIMMNTNTRVYHDRIGASIRFPREDFNPHAVADFYIAQAELNCAEGHNTFVKESCWVFEQNEDCLQKMLVNGFVPIFLVRHPADALRSYLKVEQQVGNSQWSTGRSIRHDLLYHFFKKYPGHLMISEDFIQRPAQNLREMFAVLDLPFDEAILELQALPMEVMAESTMLKNYAQFYQQTLSSTRIIDKTAQREPFELAEPALRESIARNLPFYELFLAEKRGLTCAWLAGGVD
jgi:hypothetical protein